MVTRGEKFDGIRLPILIKNFAAKSVFPCLFLEKQTCQTMEVLQTYQHLFYLVLKHTRARLFECLSHDLSLFTNSKSWETAWETSSHERAIRRTWQGIDRRSSLRQQVLLRPQLSHPLQIWQAQQATLPKAHQDVRDIRDSVLKSGPCPTIGQALGKPQGVLSQESGAKVVVRKMEPQLGMPTAYVRALIDVSAALLPV